MMKNAQNTRRITAVTLALALGVAVYLNWQYAKNDPIGSKASDSTAAAVAVQNDACLPEDTTAAAGSAAAIADGLMTEEDTLQAVDKNYGEAQLVSIAKDSAVDFFEKARLDRTKTRDSAIEDIEKSLKKASLSDTEKEQLTKKLTDYLQDVTKENEVETLIKAKGFTDCLCILQDGKADLTVMTSSGDGLNASQVAQIRDIVLKKCTELTAQDITVVEVK